MSAAAAALPADVSDELIVSARIECYLYAGWVALRLGRIEEATWLASQSLELQYAYVIMPLPGAGNTAAGLLSLVTTVRGDQTAAEQLAHEAYTAAKLSGNLGAMNTSCYALAQAYLAQGRLTAAADASGEAASISLRLRHVWFLAYCRITQGEVALAQGRPDAARQHFGDALAIRQKFGDPEGIALALTHLGAVALQENQLDAAEVHFTAGPAHYADTTDLGGVATAEEGLGQVAFRRRDWERAAQHYRQALQLAAAGSYVPRITSLLTHVGKLLLYRADKLTAGRLLACVVASPSSGDDAKEEAKRLLAQYLQGIGTGEPPEQLTLDAAVALAEVVLCHPWS